LNFKIFLIFFCFITISRSHISSKQAKGREFFIRRAKFRVNCINLAWERLRFIIAYLTISNRLSGSKQTNQARYVAGGLRRWVWKFSEKVSVPHWVRGAETAELNFQYPGQAARFRKKIVWRRSATASPLRQKVWPAEVVVARQFRWADAPRSRQSIGQNRVVAVRSAACRSKGFASLVR